MNLPWAYGQKGFFLDNRRDKDKVYLRHWDFIPLHDICSWDLSSFKNTKNLEYKIPKEIRRKYPRIFKDVLRQVKSLLLLPDPMIGQKFGKLIVKAAAPSLGRGARYECVCECGEIKIAVGTRLRTGGTLSCGCLYKKKKNFGKRHSFQGEELLLSEISQKTGIPLYTLRYRLKQGLSAEQAVDICKKGSSSIPGRKAKLYKIGDRELTALEIVKEQRISRKSLNTLLEKKDIPLEQALEEFKREKIRRKKVYHLNGEYLSITSLSKRFEIPEMTLRSRIKKGWPIERAVRKEVSKRGRSLKKHLIDGVSLTFEEISKKYDIPVSTLRKRITRGLTLEQAIRFKGKRQAKKFVVFKGEKVSVASLAKSHNIPYVNLYARLNGGMDIKDALSKPVRKKGSKRKVLFQGKEEYLTDLSKRYNISLPLLHSRLNNKWSPEEAVLLRKGTVRASYYQEMRGHR